MDASLFQGNLVNSSRILYTPSVFAKTNLIHLQETGTLQAQKPHTSKRENLASYLFFPCGKRIRHAGIRRAHLSPFRRRLCLSGLPKALFPPHLGGSVDTEWAHFYGPNMNGIYEKYVERGGAPCFHSRNPETYISILDRLYEIASSNAYIRDMKIYETLTSLLTHLMEESWNPSGSPHSASRRRDLQNVKEYLDQNYQKKISLDGLAELFYINKFYLTRIFREQFGLSINSYLAQGTHHPRQAAACALRIFL